MSPAERTALGWRASHGIVPAFALGALTPDERERVERTGSAKAQRLLTLEPGDVPMNHIIILAQGDQKRLPELLGYPKQGLRLPWCAHTPLLVRTIQQINLMSPGPETYITVIAAPMLQGVVETYGQRPGVEFVQLASPGNSALKGIARYLESIAYGSDPARDPDRTIVLLGDVVYSWRCLQQLVYAHGKRSGYRFVGTQDLSASAGELWGVAWDRPSIPAMLVALSNALEHHPPFDEYQPGQLRRWLWEMVGGPAVPGRGWIETCGFYIAVDDYTRDIDLPEHVELLNGLSRSAALDDQEYGLRWETTRTEPTPFQRLYRARRLFLALFLATCFALFWNSRMADTVLLSVNAAMWSLMLTEAHVEVRRIHKDRRPPISIS